MYGTLEPGLYLLPFVRPGPELFGERLHAATMDWVVVLSCFTQIMFQIPHNLLTAQLKAFRGTVAEWPVYSN